MRVLFVDDEVNVLNALARTLRHKKNEWDIDYATSGFKAIELFEEQPYDVVVSDMMMPQMSGEKLLDHIWRTYPETARVVLSGHCNQATAFRLVGSEHFYLSKPCSYDLLVSTLENAHKIALMKHASHHAMNQAELEDSVSGLLSKLIKQNKINTSDVPVELKYLLSEETAETTQPLYLRNEALEGCVEQDCIDWGLVAESS
ncbi:hypothetical protein MTBPR1_30328 [Candidatus Terasakiella magnetica]|uniref:Response regulatory domain-containing protein n=1 Tax=Candidatus Terasakiella magnetica TaxID=1867952 RepID=A0A1C3RI64_9PROT|nr:response regulator [Candidatus Terasakiella magnetica]SCA56958.1 hypothetical protein MTBPR1_30328 [Candidatus Terasakiella magnetica]